MRQDLLLRFEQLKDQRERASEENFKAIQRAEQSQGKAKDEASYLSKKLKKAKEYVSAEEAAEKGVDADRVRALQYTALETEAWNKAVEEKAQSRDAGFSTYQDASFQKYTKLSEKIEVASIQGQKSEKEGLDRMVADLHKDLLRRAKFSKRRKFVADEDVTYINQRNFKFNKKIARAYDDYTEDIAKSLERGTS